MTKHISIELLSLIILWQNSDNEILFYDGNLKVRVILVYSYILR